VTQAKDLKKFSRRSIQDRSPQFIRSTDNPNHTALHQLPEDLTALHPAHRLNFGPQYWLTIRDNGHGFHSRL